VAGLQVFNNRTETNSGSSAFFPGPGIEVVGAGGQNISAGESFLTTVNGGYFAQSQIGWHDWVFGTVGGRYDFSSAFGENAGGVFYPKASLSMVPSDRQGWSSTLLSTFRLRAAIGQSGRQPGAFDQFTTFAPQVTAVGAGLIPSALGNPDLKPEISTELEAGFEAGLFINKVLVGFGFLNTIFFFVLMFSFVRIIIIVSSQYFPFPGQASQLYCGIHRRSPKLVIALLFA
jgi:outer membrane receptor protein involved in Fe transport